MSTKPDGVPEEKDPDEAEFEDGDLTVECHIECGCDLCEERYFASERAHIAEEALARVSAKVKDWQLIWPDYKEAVFKVLREWSNFHKSESKHFAVENPDKAMEHQFVADAFESAIQALDDELWTIQTGVA